MKICAIHFLAMPAFLNAQISILCLSNLDPTISPFGLPRGGKPVALLARKASRIRDEISSRSISAAIANAIAITFD